jgi:hypothetical protein
MRRRVIVAAAACVAVALAWVGCGSNGNPVGFGEPDSGGGADATTTDIVEPDTGTFGGDTANTSCTGCSSDLHHVLDCDGNVMKTCDPSQGCSKGQCVAACDSAKENQSTLGCDYYTFETNDSFRRGACFAAFVANTWNAPVKIEVERAGVKLNVADFARIPSGSGATMTYAPLPNGELPAGQIAILFLAHTPGNSIACPGGVTPAYTGQDTGGQQGLHGTMRGQAFHVSTSAPVVAYDIWPYGGGSTAVSGATLLLPTSAWGTNFIAVQPWSRSHGTPEIAFIAQEDGTAVTISPTANITSENGIPGAARGVPTTYNLARGEVLQLYANEATELTGSPIQSTKPIALWGAIPCHDLYNPACDAAHQQIPPVKALGWEYALVKYRDRVAGANEDPPWRFVGAVDGTTLTYEPAAPAGAPTTLSSGQLVTFRASGPLVVKAQDDKHPFYVSAHMTGCFDSKVGAYSGVNGCAGDPEMVNVVAPDAYLDRYVFFTDPTYPETNLVVVRRKAASGFKDVTLDCAGVLTGWRPVGSSGKYEYTHVDLVTGKFAKVGSCDNGRHEIKSDAPFGVTVWGWGSKHSNVAPNAFFSEACSYAYPAGMSLKPITTVVVPPLPR